SLEGMIWNMMLDEEGKFLILEIRQNEKHRVNFTAIALDTGAVMWDGLEFEENWWVGMTAVSNGILLLHTYADNSDPEPKGLIAFDIINQEVCWVQDEFTYLKVAGNYVIGFDAGTKDKSYASISLTEGRREAVEEASVLQMQGLEKDALDAQYP